MKTIFNQKELDQLIERVESIGPDAKSQWGKMNAYQMLKHCILSERMFLGDNSYKRLFVGKLFGKMALKGILKDENPLKKNQPTHPELKITGEGDVIPLKESWKELLLRYPTSGKNEFEGFVHPFFGAMDREQVGRYVYKHTDHHLRQFGS